MPVWLCGVHDCETLRSTAQACRYYMSVSSRQDTQQRAGLIPVGVKRRLTARCGRRSADSCCLPNEPAIVSVIANTFHLRGGTHILRVLKWKRNKPFGMSVVFSNIPEFLARFTSFPSIRCWSLRMWKRLYVTYTHFTDFNFDSYFMASTYSFYPFMQKKESATDIRFLFVCPKKWCCHNVCISLNWGMYLTNALHVDSVF